MYTNTIRKWAADTRYVGTLTDPSGIGEVGLGAEQAGRQVAVRFALRLRRQRVESVRYQVYGCGYSIAACAAAAELANDHLLKDVRGITPDRIDALLEGLPEDRKYCADLAATALQAAIESTSAHAQLISSQLEKPALEHGPRVTVKDPLYRALINSPCPNDASVLDRHLFACLLTVASQEGSLGQSLGLKPTDLNRLLHRLFPRFDRSVFSKEVLSSKTLKADAETRAMLLKYVPRHSKNPLPRLLALVLAARAAQPGHLWVAMGLFARPELSAAIERLLPNLAAANTENMRWKRFFAKQICDAHGGTLCKAPTCGACPERDECFPPEEGVFQ